MQTSGYPFPSRRSILFLAGAGLAWSSSDFWDKKDSSQWTHEEIEKLLSRSPWAKEVSALAPGKNAKNSRGSTENSGPNQNPRIGSKGQMPRGRVEGGIPGNNMASRTGTVLWESAKPILEASKHTLPDSFSNHYVISLSNFVAPAGSDEDRIPEMKQGTILRPKGKDPCQAAVVEKAGTRFWLFGFPKNALQLSLEDKEVEFRCTMGRFVAQTKFTLKDMVYKGELAL
jgi:hypothetical protein